MVTRDRIADGLIALGMLLALPAVTHFIESRGSPLTALPELSLALTVWLAGIGAVFIIERRLVPVGRKRPNAAAKSEAVVRELSDTLYEKLSGTLRDYIDGLEQRDERRKELVSHVAHDLKSPLASMRGYIEKLIAEFDQVPEQERQRYLVRILDSVGYLNALITQLLDLSRLEAAELSVRKEEFRLSDLVDYLSYKFAPAAQDSSLQLSITQNDDCLVHGDRILLERAFSNLVENAIRYNRSGGMVELALTTSGDTVSFKVKDTGAGIGESDAKRIFDPFFRGRHTGDPQKPRPPGTGLGLAITRKIIRLHGGEISVESVPQYGSTFTVILPAE